MKDTLSPNSEGFLMIRIQNVCGKAILKSNSKFERVVYDVIICSKTAFKGLAPSNEVKDVFNLIRVSA